MDSVRQAANGILAAFLGREPQRLKTRLAEAQWLADAPASVDASERERRELLASVARRMRAALNEYSELHLSLLRHLAGQSPRKAMASISTCTSRGSRAASTVARAGTLWWK